MKKPKEELYIVYTSDVHCGVNENITFASLKAYVDELKGEGKNVLLVDCGDYVQGGVIGTLSKGSLIIELMNEVSYDIATFGNHEFDYGLERLLELMEEADFDLIASNVIYKGNKRNIFENIPAYVIKDFNGTKIAFIGVLTPETLRSSTPTFFMEDDQFVYDFYSGNNGQDLYDLVQSTVNEVRNKGADYVVVLSHIGSAAENVPYDSISLISHTSGIDVVLDGHSHSVITGDEYPNNKGEDVILSSVGTKMQIIGTLIIDSQGNISTTHILEYEGRDEEMAAMVENSFDTLDDILSQKVADLDFDLKIYDEEGIRMSRSRELPLGNYVADAIRYVTDTDVAIFNGGGIRTGIDAGEVTYGDLLNVVPFQNYVASIYVTGQQILDALELSGAYAEAIYKFDGNAVGEFGGFLHVSGLKYTIDTSLPTPVILDENNFPAAIEGDRRVKDVMVLENDDYVPIDPEKLYTLGGMNYTLFRYGDGHTSFKGSEVIVNMGMSDVEVLKKYAEDFGFDEQYARTQGRITIE